VAVVVVARGIREGEEGRVVLGNREVVVVCLRFLEENQIEVVAGWRDTTMIRVLHKNMSSAKIERLTGVRLTRAPRRGTIWHGDVIIAIFFLFLLCYAWGRAFWHEDIIVCVLCAQANRSTASLLR
jgi:hypothetical protein